MADLVPIIDLDIIRKSSLEQILQLRLPINPNLPILEEYSNPKNTTEIENRLFCLLAVAASSYGFCRDDSLSWLKKETLVDSLEGKELQFLETGSGDTAKFKAQIEGMWALSWAIGLIPNIDFTKKCPNTFVSMLPDLKRQESIHKIRRKSILHSYETIVKIADFAYCLHWGIVHRNTEGNFKPFVVENFVIEERRRALDWILSSESWYNIQIDT